MGDDIADFVDDIPEHYDRGLGPVIFADYAADLARRVTALNPSRVLETAAGTGIMTRQLRNLLPASAFLMATDLNPAMLEAAKAKFPPAEQVEFRQADACGLPFPDGAFDLVVCQFGLMFFPDRSQAHREAHRVLAPGGRYLFNVWDSIQRNPFARRAHEVVTGFFPVDPPQFYCTPFSCHSIDSIKDSLFEAGFADIAVDVVQTRKEILDVALFAHGLVYGNPLIGQIRARGGVDPDQIVAVIMEGLRLEFGAERPSTPLQAIIVSAAKP